MTEKVFTAVVAYEKKHIEEKGLQYLGPYTFAAVVLLHQR